MEFKEGDIVICINNYSSLRANDEGLITGNKYELSSKDLKDFKLDTIFLRKQKLNKIISENEFEK